MKKERTGIIYMATVNGRSYVGQTVDFKTRKNNHLRDARIGKKTAFHNSIRKHGAHNVKWEILEKDILESELNEREKYWINFYVTYPDGLNMTAGGETSPTKNPEVAARQAASLSKTLLEKSARGEHPMQNPEVIAKVSATVKVTMRDLADRGELPVQNDPEVQEKIRQTWLEMSARGENPMHNPECVEKMRKSLAKTLAEKKARGEEYRHPPEVYERISKAVSKTLRDMAERGEHPMQNPEVSAKAGRTHKEKIKRGEHCSQQQWWKDRVSEGTKRGQAKWRLEERREAGQQFLLDMNLDDDLGDSHD